MSDQALRSKIIRLAHANPALRPHLLPLVTAATAKGEWSKWLSLTAQRRANILSNVWYKATKNDDLSHRQGWHFSDKDPEVIVAEIARISQPEAEKFRSYFK